MTTNLLKDLHLDPQLSDLITDPDIINTISESINPSKFNIDTIDPDVLKTVSNTNFINSISQGIDPKLWGPDVLKLVQNVSKLGIPKSDMKKMLKDLVPKVQNLTHNLDQQTTSEPHASKYWTHMFNPDQIISYQTPTFSYPTHDLTFDTQTSSDKILQFIKTYNKTSFGNITVLTQQLFDSFKSLHGYYLGLVDSTINQSLVGTIFSIPIPIHSPTPYEYSHPEALSKYITPSSNVIFHGCTSFLCLHPDYRNKGLGMALIQRLIELGFNDKLICGYHLTSQKLTPDSIPISAWYRPINIEKCRKAGFEFPTFKKSSDRNNTRDRLMYSVRLPKDYQIIKMDKGNYSMGYKWYLKFTHDLTFKYYPNDQHWYSWIHHFDTYLVKNCGKPIGLFSLKPLTISTSKNSSVSMNLLLFMCGSPDILSSVLHVSSNVDIVYGYKVTSITDDSLSKILATSTKNPVWLSLYNHHLSLSPQNICIPLF